MRNEDPRGATAAAWIGTPTQKVGIKSGGGGTDAHQEDPSTRAVPGQGLGTSATGARGQLLKTTPADYTINSGNVTAVVNKPSDCNAPGLFSSLPVCARNSP